MKSITVEGIPAYKVINWLDENVSPMLDYPKDPKFIPRAGPWARGDRWHVFTYKETVEVWLPDEAASLFVLRFVE